MSRRDAARGRPRRHRDGGNAIVEFALWLPIVLLVLVSCVQLASALYDARAADDAARVALRAQQSGADPDRAAHAALGDRPAVVATGEGEVHVVLPIRRVVPWLPTSVRTVTGTAGGRP